MKEPARSVKGAPDSARFATPFVLLVWLGMLVWAHRFIATCAPLFPVLDEKSAWRVVLPPYGELTWRSLWEPHNEHRIPLPRLVYYCLYELTGDLRPGLLLQVEILGLVSLGMIVLARRVRGHTSFADAIFPLLWLHIGNAVNLLSGFQLALTLPTALVSAILVAAAISPARPRALRALGCGLPLASLPLCGGVGISQAPALAAWIAWTGWCGRRSADPAKRRGSRILLISVLACVALAGVYAWGYSLSSGKEYPFSLPTALSMGAAMLALGFGPSAQTLWPASAAIVLGIYGATLALLVVGLNRKPRERGRRLGILASIAATTCLVVVVVGGRSDLGWRDGFPLRYVTLTTPLLCSAYLAWELYGGRIGKPLLPKVLALAALAMLPGNVRIGSEHGIKMRVQVQELEQRIAQGAGPAEILELYSLHFRGDPRFNLGLLRLLASEHRPPFDLGRGPPAFAFDFPTFGRTPSRVQSEQAVSVRSVSGSLLTLVCAGTRIHIQLFPGDSMISGRFGIPDQMVARERSGGVRVLLEVLPREGPPSTLLDRRLQPGTVESDRGLQAFSVTLSQHEAGEIVLRTESLAEDGSVPSWSCWSDLEIQ